MKTKICLFGLSLFSGNKGCEALAYAFLDLLSEIAVEKQNYLEISLFQPFKEDISLQVPKAWKGLDISFYKTSFKDIERLQTLKKIVSHSEICFDFTEGDSFSDIYGIWRFASQTLIKTVILATRTLLVLGPQTYGPFKHISCRKWASWIVRKSYSVFSRDEESALLLEKIAGRKPFVTTDIAMALNAEGISLTETEKIRIGINVSALLWNGGYTGKNQFNLTVDYKAYLTSLLSELSKHSEYEIYLIPHVITEDYDSCENDLKVCRELNDKFSNCILLESVTNPAEIKNLISQMDFFTGARMHSTIAAFSTGVPVLPFAYSKKFENLYGTLHYQHVLDGRCVDTEKALNVTLDAIFDRKALVEDVKKSFFLCKELLSQFKFQLIKLLE